MIIYCLFEGCKAFNKKQKMVGRATTFPTPAPWGFVCCFSLASYLFLTAAELLPPSEAMIESSERWVLAGQEFNTNLLINLRYSLR